MLLSYTFKTMSESTLSVLTENCQRCDLSFHRSFHLPLVFVQDASMLL